MSDQMPAAQPSDPVVAIALLLGRQTQILRQLLGEGRSEIEQIGVTNAPPAQLVLDNFPVPGTKRLLARRTGNGFDNFAVDSTGALFLPSNESRLGGQVTNTGSAPITLYLSDQQAAGVPAVYLSPGSSWDFRFGNLLWCGDVYAVATTSSTLAGGEL